MHEIHPPLTSEDIHPHLPEPGGSLVILQRHARVSKGKTVAISAKQARKIAKTMTTKLLTSLNEEERSSVDFLVIGSDPRIGAYNEEHPESLASLETANEVLEGIREATRALEMKPHQVINTTAVPDGGIVEVSEIKGWLSIKDSPELFAFLEKKAKKTGEDVTLLYETDAYKEKREKIGVEGARDVGARLEHFMSFSRGSTNYHTAHPGRRLIFWAITRFDTITPYARLILAHPAECSAVIPVDYLGGVVVNIKPDHTATLAIKDKQYATNLYYPIVTG